MLWKKYDTQRDTVCLLLLFSCFLHGHNLFNIQESTLREFTWRERFFDKIKVEDPLLPKIDKKYEIRHYLTAPFRLDNKDK